MTEDRCARDDGTRHRRRQCSTRRSSPGRAILVTGGGSGLGLAMATTFAAHGAKVAIAGRKRERLEARRRRSPPARARAARSPSFPPTSGIPTRPRASSRDAAARFGTLDGLVNNAAGNFLAFSEELTPNGFDAVVRTVLYGSVNCTLAFGRHLLERSAPGSVVSIATTYAWTGTAYALPSACAKAGVLAMTRSLAVEWGAAGIRLNAIAPGPIRTEGAFSRLIPTPAGREGRARADPARPLRREAGDREPRALPPLGPLPVPDRRLRDDGRRRVARRRRAVLATTARSRARCSRPASTR